MSTVQELPPVQECSVGSCSYNADAACHAGAITVGGEHAHCGTFVEIPLKGGLDRVGRVGACHRQECRHNDDLECGAPSVRVGPARDVADCLTFEPR
ncbi:DUF1540 domain-containing protein [Vallicoccus soli]|uniref:DUF1540 domain-containing protein n=1 Tax=Vallicoccus soli TaxID=2339232 RepID=A0A3A3ZM12_9ACTN|nr:DUF1540 domain-containing protein [Vallicoccus soli]RJK97615.1 DUF1540 domain-containing protein [Vallicoccus soli]